MKRGTERERELKKTIQRKKVWKEEREREERRELQREALKESEERNSAEVREGR